MEMNEALCESTDTVTPDAECEALRLELQRRDGEISLLRQELERHEREAEYGRLWAELFPGMSEERVPEAVLSEAEERGLPVIAAYALHARRCEMRERRARLESICTSGKNPGACLDSTGCDLLFTLDEIRGMTPREVRRHYRQIIKSLGKRD